MFEMHVYIKLGHIINCLREIYIDIVRMSLWMESARLVLMTNIYLVMYLDVLNQ